tara:strand:- start:165 stop:356 length:192 start_codon:yes stop_codon:yes gene_type:complete
MKMNKIFKSSDIAGNWIGVGTAIGAAVFAATNEPVWIAVGVAIGAALSTKCCSTWLAKTKRSK